ncbi:hypothetical protein [Vibrio sp. CyArs1]|uniref:hypothetical protein n=1 Tax=Vibrio sp. CyArs1 TaxID=2682577 RepID=UPI001F05767C|nr:hypothetical protein [Vibrio sp. CyArs1]
MHIPLLNAGHRLQGGDFNGSEAIELILGLLEDGLELTLAFAAVNLPVEDQFPCLPPFNHESTGERGAASSDKALIAASLATSFISEDQPGFDSTFLMSRALVSNLSN